MPPMQTARSIAPPSYVNLRQDHEAYQPYQAKPQGMAHGYLSSDHGAHWKPNQVPIQSTKMWEFGRAKVEIAADLKEKHSLINKPNVRFIKTNEAMRVLTDYAYDGLYRLPIGDQNSFYRCLNPILKELADYKNLYAFTYIDDQGVQVLMVDKYGREYKFISPIELERYTYMGIPIKCKRTRVICLRPICKKLAHKHWDQWDLKYPSPNSRGRPGHGIQSQMAPCIQIDSVDQVSTVSATEVSEAPDGLKDEILSANLGQGSMLEIDEALASKENNLQIVPWNISRRDDFKNKWDAIWKDINDEFEQELSKSMQLKELSNDMFYVWDGNHKSVAWMEAIQEKFSNSKKKHCHVLFPIIDPTKVSEIALLSSLQRMNFGGSRLGKEPIVDSIEDNTVMPDIATSGTLLTRKSYTFVFLSEAHMLSTSLPCDTRCIALVGDYIEIIANFRAGRKNLSLIRLRKRPREEASTSWDVDEEVEASTSWDVDEEVDLGTELNPYDD
ncbi:hypothetical protein L7F22_044967 [Adiantum nelumboides]|nr:hypothetical protein [Adiantum nelumboides]